MKFYPLLAAAGLMAVSCSPKQPAETAPTEDDVILHAWSWSFDTIAANMQQIADAGYGYVQTSPAQACFVGDNGGMHLYSNPGDTIEGKWYYYYQPTDWTIGNYALGNRDQLKAMLDSANKYGVKVIVDVLPNHTAIDHTAVLPTLDAAVGGHENLFHANGFTPITQWNDRMECTTGEMGGLPDVNTENPDFQKYYMAYVNDLLALGVRGFRYDTAKHIGLPSDPLDPKTEANGWTNNFWPVVLGQEPVDGITLIVPRDSLFIYGEVLQDKNVKEDEYAALMGVTASNYGHVLREVLANGGNIHTDSLGTDTIDIVGYYHKASPDRLVTWVESHDTYANAHESAGLTDDQIRSGYVFLTARQHGTPLFFSRPAGSTRQNYWGNNVLGARGNDEYFNPEVVAANKFRKAMSGKAEQVYFNENGTVAEIVRGKAGAALVNFSDYEQPIVMPTDLPAGTYTDAVHNAQFQVADGFLTGTLARNASYILYAK